MSKRAALRDRLRIWVDCPAARCLLRLCGDSKDGDRAGLGGCPELRTPPADSPGGPVGPSGVTIRGHLFNDRLPIPSLGVWLAILLSSTGARSGPCLLRLPVSGV